MLIQKATADVTSSRRHHQRELAERNQLRELVVVIDEVITACEETHLLSIKKCPNDLKERRKHVLVQVLRTVSRTGQPDVICTVEEQLSREVRKVTDVMDSLWVVQGVIFDLMHPWLADGEHARRDESDLRWRPNNLAYPAA